MLLSSKAIKAMRKMLAKPVRNSFVVLLFPFRALSPSQSTRAFRARRLHTLLYVAPLIFLPFSSPSLPTFSSRLPPFREVYVPSVQPLSLWRLSFQRLPSLSPATFFGLPSLFLQFLALSLRQLVNSLCLERPTYACALSLSPQSLVRTLSPWR